MEPIRTNAKTVELTGEEMHLHFTSAFPYFWLRNDSDDTASMSLSPNIEHGKDGVIEVPAGSSAGTMHGYNATCNDLYLLGSGKVQIMATGKPPVNPFDNGEKGGEKKSISAEMGYVSNGLKCHYSADSKHFQAGWRIDDLSGNGNAGLFFTKNGREPSYLANSGNYINLNQKYIIMPQMNYNQVTLEAVCRFPNTPSEEVDIISNLEAGGYCIFYEKNSGMFKPYVRIEGAYRATQGIENDYRVHLFTATYDNKLVNFYTDGILVGTTDITGNIDFPSANTVLAINANPYGGNAQENYLGVGSFNFYSARVYNRALSADEIAQNFLIDQSLFWEN